MSAVAFEAVDIVFGDKPHTALPLMERGLSREQTVGAMDQVDHRRRTSASDSSREAGRGGMASPACAVCNGALNLLSQVGAPTLARFRSGARLPTHSLLAQDRVGSTNTAGSASSRVSPRWLSDN